MSRLAATKGASASAPCTNIDVSRHAVERWSRAAVGGRQRAIADVRTASNQRESSEIKAGADATGVGVAIGRELESILFTRGPRDPRRHWRELVPEDRFRGLRRSIERLIEPLAFEGCIVVIRVSFWR